MADGQPLKQLLIQHGLNRPSDGKSKRQSQCLSAKSLFAVPMCFPAR